MVVFPYEDEAISFRSNVSTGAPYPYWVSVAPRRINQASVSRGKQYELDTVQTGEYAPVYDNRDGALSPQNSASPYYPNVTPFRPVRKRCQSPATQNMFTANEASAGQALATAVDGPIAPGNNVPGVTSTVAVPVVTASATAFEGSSVFQSSIPASVAANAALILLSTFTVMPGQPHTFSIYVRTPTGSVGVSVQAAIAWQSVAGEISRSLGSVVSLPVASNTWTRLTVTGTPPTTAVGAWAGVVTTNSPSASYTFQSDGLQLEYAAAATAWTKPGTWYPVFTGWIERWPLRWEQNGLFNKTSPTCVDHFGYLSQAILKPPFHADVLALGPNFFYTFDQGAGAQYVTDLSHNKPPAPVTTTQFGAGSLTFGNAIQYTTPVSTANVAGGGFLGGATQVATFNNGDVGGSAVAATYIDLTPNGGPAPGATGYYTRLIAFRKPAGIPANSYPLIWSWNQASYSAPYGGINGFEINPSSGGQPGYASFASTGTYFNGSTVSVCDGDWHLFGAVINPTAQTLQLQFDGNTLGVGSGLTSLNITKLGGDTVGVGIVRGSNVAQEPFVGDVAFIAEFPFALSSSQFSQLWTSFKNAYTGDSSAARYSRILGWTNFQGAQNMTPGPLTGNMGPASDITQGGQKATIYSPTTGTDAQTALQNVATTENGNHFVAANGAITFQSRAARYGVFPPFVTFGESESTGEIPYDDCGFDFDLTRVGNDCQVTQYMNSAVYEALNPTSQGQYGTRTLTRTINSASASECNDAANYLAYRYGNPDMRLRALKIHVTAHPQAWTSLLSLDFGMRCRVMRRDIAGTIQWDGFLEQAKWSFDYDNNDVWLDLQLSPADRSAFWQVNAMHTTLASAVTVTTLNSNPTFESGISPWAATGGTVAQSSTQVHSGLFSAKFTPNGTTGSPYLESEQVPVTAGNSYAATAWVWFTNAVTTYVTTIAWYNSSHVLLTSTGTAVSVAAGTWTQVQTVGTAPAGAAYATVAPLLGGTPPATNVWYVDDATLTNAVTSVTLNPLNTAANLPISAYMSYSYPVPSGTAPGGGSVDAALILRFDPGLATQEDITVTSLVSTGGSGGLNYTSFTATFNAPMTYSHTLGAVVSERLTNPYTAITTTNDATAYDSNSVLGTTTILSY